MRNISLLNEKKILENLAEFEGGFGDVKDDGRKPWARYASFDYCFNYFQGYQNKGALADEENMQNSCLHLAFYLASWGMLRGSSFLLQKSIKFYEPVIRYISNIEDAFWKIDVPNYSETNIKSLVKRGDEIKKLLSDSGKNKVSDTLVTKIMLGVFGNVPAFDAYFKNGSGLSVFSAHTLREISNFYRVNNYPRIISKEADKIKTFEFSSRVKSSRSYTTAKVIDMIFFIEGYKNSRKH